MNRNGPQLLKTTNQMQWVGGWKGRRCLGLMFWEDEMNEGVEELFGSYLKGHQMKVIRSAFIFWRQGSQVPRYQELIEFLWMVRTVWITLGCLLPWDHLVNMAMEHLPWMCIVYGKERCLRNIWQLYLFTRGCNICGLSLLILVDPCLGPFSNQHGFKWQICGWKGSSKRACPAGKLGSEPILVGKKSMEIHSGLGSSNCMRAAIQKKHTI